MAKGTQGKGVRKKGLSLGPFSCYLEENIPVNFLVLGSRDWLAHQFEPGALTPEQQVVISDVGDMAPHLEWLSKQKVHGVDSEGNGLNPRKDQLTLCQVGTEEKVLMFQPDMLEEFKPLLESEDYLHILQNAVHDFKFFWNQHKVHMWRMADTMLTEQLLTAGRVGMSVGLIDIVRRYPPYRLISKEVRKQFFDFAGPFTRKMAYYAARDIILMFPAFREQCRAVKQFKMEQVCQDEFDCIPCTGMIELGGVFIDSRIIELAMTYFFRRAGLLEKAILEEWAVRIDKQGDASIYLFDDMRDTFDLGSSSKKLEALQQIGLDIDDTKRDTLAEINDPIAQMLVEYSEVMKVVSTYGPNLLARVDPTTGLLYPEFNQLGSGEMEERRGRAGKGTIATGRMSSDFQQLPRPEKRYAEVDDPEELAMARRRFAVRLAELTPEEVYA